MNKQIIEKSNVKVYVINGTRILVSHWTWAFSRNELINEAKALNIKSAHKMDKETLATNILETLVKKEGNYIDIPDMFEAM